MSTEVILERLASLGIVVSVEEVVEQARVEHAARAIAEGWRERFALSSRGDDDEFIDLAACVLWERLLPERPSFEMLEYFFNCCQEFENELGNAGVHDPRYWRTRIQYVNEFLAQFSAEDEQPLVGNFLRAEAEALWSLGERAHFYLSEPSATSSLLSLSLQHRSITSQMANPLSTRKGDPELGRDNEGGRIVSGAPACHQLHVLPRLPVSTSTTGSTVAQQHSN